jgi:hypothetical protein
VLVDPAGDPVSLISVQKSNDPPVAPEGAGDFRWIETSTNVEYQWDATLERWVEVRPVILTAFSSTSITATAGVGTFGAVISLNTELVVSGFRVVGSGIGTATDYYNFFPGIFRVGSGVRTDLTDYALDNRLFADTNFNSLQRIDRQLFTIDSEPTLFVVRAVKFAAAANFGNAAFALQVHRVRTATP